VILSISRPDRGGSGFSLSLRLTIPRTLTDRRRHDPPGYEVAETALIRNRVMAQELDEEVH
jgi:hypothetical protein